ncbi:MAG: exo-alpha-sialidase [Planctomycetes bacterium]|nr:exo-alpha-sialidase [Planctomycetota bacterium]
MPPAWMTLLLATLAPLAAHASGLVEIRLALVDGHATGYGTFQSHNQKVVSNRNGFFMTHIRSRNEPFTAQEWRLSWSEDGGETFRTLFQATHATNPPVLETDEEGNLFLVRPDFLDGNAYLYRFRPADRYAGPPLVSAIPKGSAGKFAMALDAGRRRLYYFAHNDTFHVLSLEGEVLSMRTLLRPGKSAALQYPLLSLDAGGLLCAAWTTQAHGRYLYWDIHAMASLDGGATWRRLDGAALEPPVVADEGGPADRIVLGDELEAHTWLSSLLARDGKLHFAYLAQTSPPRQHYVRLDAKTGRRDRDVQPEWKGEELSLRSLDGFFASRAALPGAPIYCVMRAAAESRLACLASDDGGETWYDYAAGVPVSSPYAIGGCRELTSEGFVIGSFTEQPAAGTGPGSQSRVVFFKLQAGLASAEVAKVAYEGGRAKVELRNVRGQPSEARFSAGGDRWTAWQPFQASLEAEVASRPARLQLKSRLGVVSTLELAAGGR